MTLTDYQVKDVAPDLAETDFIRIVWENNLAIDGRHLNAVYRYAANRRLSPAFLLAMFRKESQFGKVGTATQTHSWGNTRPPSFGLPHLGTVPGRSGVFSRYTDWGDGGISTVARLYDHAPYFGKNTVRAIIPVWAPSSENDTEKYIKDVLADIERWAGSQGTGGAVVAVNKPKVDTGHRSPNHSGYAKTRRVDAVIWHITQGTNSLGWLTNPASGASSNYLLARDGTIYELVPPDTDAWANGRVCRPDLDHNQPLVAKWQQEGVNFNQRTVSVEHEGFTSGGKGGSLTKAQIEATVKLTAWLCQEFRLTPDRRHIFGHFEIDSCDRPNCPGFSSAEWTDWIGRVGALLAGTPTPAMMEPVVTEGQDWGGKGRLISEETTVVNDDTGKYYSRKKRYAATGVVIDPWREV